MTLPCIDHVLIGDASPVEAIGLASILRRAAHCSKISAVADWSSLLGAAQPDVDMILLDVALPGYVSASGLADIRSVAPSARLVLLTSDRIDGATSLLEAGVRGFIPKQLAADELIAALRMVASGQIFLPVATWRALTSKYSAANSARSYQLSERQQQVLALASEGYSNKEIGAKLNISESTVKVHVSAVLRVLGVSSRGRAVAAFNAIKSRGGSALSAFLMGLEPSDEFTFEAFLSLGGTIASVA